MSKYQHDVNTDHFGDMITITKLFYWLLFIVAIAVGAFCIFS